MSFPKKGTRRIVVSGDTYLWRVAVDEDWMNPMPPNPTDLHSLAVESPDHPGRYLAVQFALPEEHTGLGFAIAPAIVADVISAAIALGWPEVDKPWHRTWRSGQLQDDHRRAAQQGVAADDVLPATLGRSVAAERQDVGRTELNRAGPS
jgi:hypothetical protein